MPEPSSSSSSCSVSSACSSRGGLRRRPPQRWLGSFGTLILAVLFLSLAALAATVTWPPRYRALTHEEVAATVLTQPSAPDRFTATFTFADGTKQAYEIAGNAIYVDAHIVKWHPFANVLGLHTAYQLDRVGGRYDNLEDEQKKPRSIFTLSAPKRGHLPPRPQPGLPGAHRRYAVRVGDVRVRAAAHRRRAARVDVGTAVPSPLRLHSTPCQIGITGVRDAGSRCPSSCRGVPGELRIACSPSLEDEALLVAHVVEHEQALRRQAPGEHGERRIPGMGPAYFGGPSSTTRSISPGACWSSAERAYQR